MKKSIQLLFLFSLISQFCVAQITIQDFGQIKNRAHFKEGEEAFYRNFGVNLRYPNSLVQYPEVCTVLGVIKVNRSGEIVEISTLNKVRKPFQKQFEEVAKLTDKKWVPSNDTADFFYSIIPIEFTYNGAEYKLDLANKPKSFEETVVVQAFSEKGFYQDDSYYLEKIEKLISKKKNKKAIKMIEELISQQPLNTEYYRMLININNQSGNLDEVEYYTELLKLLTT